MLVKTEGKYRPLYTNAAVFDASSGKICSTRALALYVGTETIGMAVSDELSITLRGLTTLERKTPVRDFEELGEFVDEYSPDFSAV